MAGIVYSLCAVTALACAVMLFSAYKRSGNRLLLWSSLCFAGLAVNSALLFIDLVLVPSVDLALPRAITALLAMAVMVHGLVWDVR